ncbi:N-acetylneuraminate lyase-like [Neodiprion fabricii]|uniref:N-acetylneuraminate lyase-like n=1 Tax=Neodiprion fabricii TaxID=2872261 RepID=UPI001ED90CD3|nr:N-acetylneuraminate lyase-like [Neodiprion fabricii]
MPRLPFTFRGYVAPVFTPFLNDSTRSLNLSFIPQYAQFLLERGIPGVLVNGSLGEGPSMNVEERKSVLEAWVRAVKSTKQHLMVQIGGGSLPDVLELAKHAEKLGVDSILCLPELYFKPKTPKQLVEYLRIVGQAAPRTPLLYYHVPMFSNVDINMVEFLEAVGNRIPSFVGMKFTSPNLSEATDAMHVNDKEFAIFVATDQTLAGAFVLGHDSAIAGTLNVFGDQLVDIQKASKSGEWKKAQEIQKTVAKSIAAVIQHGHFVETMKVAMALLTPFDMGPPRAPLCPASAEKAAAIRESLKALGYQLSN